MRCFIQIHFLFLIYQTSSSLLSDLKTHARARAHTHTHTQYIYTCVHICIPKCVLYLLNYLLTPWCRILLEKLTGLQLVKKCLAFHGTPKVHYRTHKRPPPVPILGLPNPVHIPTSHLLEIHPNIHPSTPRSPQWSPSLLFSVYFY